MFTVQIVNSTAIRLVAYDYSEGILRVIFRGYSGYDYEVEEELFELLATSPSVGTTFKRLKLSTLPHRKLERAEVIEFLLELVRRSDRLVADMH